jgi:hypothetical protein
MPQNYHRIPDRSHLLMSRMPIHGAVLSRHKRKSRTSAIPSLPPKICHFDRSRVAAQRRNLLFSPYRVHAGCPIHAVSSHEWDIRAKLEPCHGAASSRHEPSAWVPHLRRGFIAPKVGNRAKRDPPSTSGLSRPKPSQITQNKTYRECRSVSSISLK